jgi:hypothetical protein
MKRRFSVVLMVIMTMAIFASTAFAAPAQSNKSVTLVSVEYNEGGIILLFHTSGLTKNDLENNSFAAHSSNRTMDCNFIDDTTDVRCVLPKKLAQYQGEAFHVILAGFGFYDTFPANTYCPAGEIPWTSYNEIYNGETMYSGVVPMKIWNQALTGGFFAYAAQYGVTFEMNGHFCSSQNFGPA